jgi:hypothetical protein
MGLTTAATIWGECCDREWQQDSAPTPPPRVGATLTLVVLALLPFMERLFEDRGDGHRE